MTTPSVTGFAYARDAVPTVGTTAERDARFPTPPSGFKVFNVEAGALQRYAGSAWVTSVSVAVNAADYGCLTSATAAANAAGLQAAIDATPDHGTLVIPPGAYNLAGTPTIEDRTGLTVLADGAVFTLSGAGSCFLKLAGTNNRLRIRGATVVGSNTLADDQWGIGTISPVDFYPGGTDITVEDCVISDVSRGITFDVNQTYDFSDVTIQHCRLTNILGTTSGHGYGIVVSGTRFAKVLYNYVERAQRHSIYVSAGDDTLVLGNHIYRHRYGIGTANTVGALEIARCSRVQAIGNLMVECEDGGMDVLPDESATRAARNILVMGNTFVDSVHQDLVVGNQGPDSSGAFENITIVGNVFVRPSSATNNRYAIRVFHGRRVRIANNSFDGDRSYSITIAPIYLSAAVAATWSNDIVIADNTAYYTATGGGYVAFVEVGSALCTGSSRVVVRDNHVSLSGGSGGALMLYDVTRTSTSIDVSGNNLADTTGVNATPAIAGRQTISADRGDANVTLDATVDATVQRFATTLTANRTVTLPSSGVYNGMTFRIVRTGLGAFTLDVGGLKTIPSATAAFVDVVYTGSAWVLSGYGTL